MHSLARTVGQGEERVDGVGRRPAIARVEIKAPEAIVLWGFTVFVAAIVPVFGHAEESAEILEVEVGGGAFDAEQR